MAEQHDHHHRRGDNSEEGGDFELQQEVGRRQQQRVALRRLGINRPHRENADDEAASEQQRTVHGFEENPGTARHSRAHLYISRRFFIRKILAAPTLTAMRRMTPSNIGWSRGLARNPSAELASTTRKQKVMARSTATPKIVPIAPPEPPSIDVPPMTPAGVGISVWVPG